ncbi:hypothetical protein AKJ16_DCAP07104 [Drosera capensis]
MDRKFTLIQTVATASVFSVVSGWYGFMFGRESARKELEGLIEELRGAKSASVDDDAVKTSTTATQES